MSACLLARAKLARYVADLRKSPVLEQGTTVIKAGFLASPTSTIGNVAGNSLMGTLEQFVTRPTAAGLDYLLAVGKAVTDSRPGGLLERIARNRSVTNSLRPGVVRAGLRGAAEGTREAAQTLRTGVDASADAAKWDLQRVHVANPILNAFQEKVFLWMGAQDRPFWSSAFRSSLEERARTLATREGLKGADFDARVEQLRQAPTDEMSLGAIEDANYVTFKDETALGLLASRGKAVLKRLGEPTTAKPKGNPRLRQAAQVLHAVTEVTVPFTGVPTSVAAKLIDYSPAGFLRTLAEQLPKSTRSQRGFALGTARAAVGTTAMALGWALAKEGRLTGAEPTDRNERQQWTLEGKMPNAIKIGGAWHSLQRGAPVTMMPLLGANLYQMARTRGASTLGSAVSSPDVLAATAGGQAKSLADQTFLTGVQSLIEAGTDPDRSAGKFAASLAGSIVPPIVGRVANGLDQTVRQPSSIGQRLQAKIPGASQSLPERLNAFGEPLTRTGGMAGALLDPTNTRTATDTPLLREMDRLGVTVGLPGKTVHIGGHTVSLDPEQYNAYLRAAGPATKRALEALMNDPGYAGATDDQRADAMRRIIERVRTAVRDQYKADWQRTHHDTP